MACTKIRMQSLPKMAKIEVANTHLSVCFETDFVFPELMRGFIHAAIEK